MLTRNAFLSFCLSSLLLGLTGCANYQLGTGADTKGFASIYIAPIKNEAASPQSIAILTREIRTAISTGGRSRLAQSPTQAEAVLEIRLADRDRSFTSVNPNDTALASKFDLTLTAFVTLIDQRTGQAVFEDREIQVTRQIYVDGGQTPAEYQVMPQLAATLADRVIHSVLDVW